jgi:hypothetical protein
MVGWYPYIGSVGTYFVVRILDYPALWCWVTLPFIIITNGATTTVVADASQSESSNTTLGWMMIVWRFLDNSSFQWERVSSVQKEGSGIFHGTLRNSNMRIYSIDGTQRWIRILHYQNWRCLSDILWWKCWWLGQSQNVGGHSQNCASTRWCRAHATIEEWVGMISTRSILVAARHHLGHMISWSGKGFQQDEAMIILGGEGSFGPPILAASVVYHRNKQEVGRGSTRCGQES